MHKLVCITGLTGSGKSVASDYFAKKGFNFLRFGQITLDEIKRLGLEPNEQNERPIREGFRKKYGMAAFAILNLPKFFIFTIKFIGIFSTRPFKTNFPLSAFLQDISLHLKLQGGKLLDKTVDLVYYA